MSKIKKTKFECIKEKNAWKSGKGCLKLRKSKVPTSNVWGKGKLAMRTTSEQLRGLPMR